MQVEVSLEKSVRRIEGPLLFLERKADLGLNSFVEVLDRHGRSLTGRVAALDDDSIVVEVLESTDGLGVYDTAHPHPERAAAVRGRTRHARSHLRQHRPPHRWRRPDRSRQAHAHRWARHQPGGAHAAARLHRDRRVKHRSHEQSGARSEAAAVLRGRPAA